MPKPKRQLTGVAKDKYRIPKEEILYLKRVIFDMENNRSRLQQAREHAQYHDTPLSWTHVAAALKADMLDLSYVNRSLKKSIQMHTQTANLLSLWVSHQSLHAPKPTTTRETWQSSHLMLGDPALRKTACEWISKQMVHNTPQAMADIPFPFDADDQIHVHVLDDDDGVVRTKVMAQFMLPFPRDQVTNAVWTAEGSFCATQLDVFDCNTEDVGHGPRRIQLKTLSYLSSTTSDESIMTLRTIVQDDAHPTDKKTWLMETKMWIVMEQWGPQYTRVRTFFTMTQPFTKRGFVSVEEYARFQRNVPIEYPVDTKALLRQVKQRSYDGHMEQRRQWKEHVLRAFAAARFGRVRNNLKMGLVGLPNVGKSSLFNLLTAQSVAAENFPFCTIDPNEARCAVPDERYECEYPAYLQCTDIAGLIRGASEGAGLGNAFLSHIQAVDGIFHVIRAFESEEVVHVDDTVDPIRDLETIQGELCKKDLSYVLAQRKARETDVRKNPTMKLPPLFFTVMDTVQELLEANKSIASKNDWTAPEVDKINELIPAAITTKPIIYLVNLTKRDFIRKGNKWLVPIKQWVDSHGGGVMIPFSVEFEQELWDQRKVNKEFVPEVPSVLPRIIKVGGFIKAEVVGFEDFKTLSEGDKKGMSKVKAAGKYRQEGKTYVVQDGDIIYFQFNVTNKKK
ncbi:hypothetical protein DYB30_009616 [Aphanomyces astaci]|uniref:OBG-type G domain-containing protein n=1 Tax=Aphanomyces astaci TaxID=112090 RepID=A0A397D3C7_APHAT|nr:hypothetical protein DYB30_009616 [Aphanomyces astaci]